jgi:hypothetical protein
MNNCLAKYGFAFCARNSQFIFLLFACVLFALTASAPLFWENGHATLQLLGYGDYLSPFNSRNVMHSLFYTYDPNFSGGINQSFNQSYLFYYAFHYLIESVVDTPAIASTVILSALLFISQAGFCIYILEKLRATLCLTNSLIIVSGSVIYGLSPYFVTNTFPGHISALILFAFVPYLFLLLDRYLASNTYVLSFHNSIILIFVLIAAAPAFANIGNFIALVLGMAIYATGYLLTRSSQKRNLLMKFSIFIALIVLLNSWWMIPFFAGLIEHIQLNVISNQIAGAVRYATQYATLNNIYSGLPEALFHIQGLLKNQLYTQWYACIGMLLIFTAILGLFIKTNHTIRSWLASLLLLLLSSAFITKGLNAPFGWVFEYLLNNLTIFSIFRRPGSKIYWAYLFSLIVIATFIGVIFSDAAKKRSLKQASMVSLFFAVAAGIAVILFVQTPLLKGVTPSKGYFQAAELLNSYPSTRILALPSTDAQPHTMTGQNEGYYGVDVFRNMLKHSVLIPDLFAAAGGANTPLVSHLNILADNMANSLNSCENYKQLGISYVVFRTDVLMNSNQRTQYINMLKSSRTSTDLQFIGQYGSVIIFKVKPECFLGIFERTNPSIQNKDNILANRISPTTIQFEIRGDANEFTFLQRENYSKAWVISVNDVSIFKAFMHRAMKMVYYITAPDKLSNANDLLVNIRHVRCFGWANCWHISQNLNHDSRKLTLRYILQDFFYLGILITAITSILLIAIGIIRDNPNKQPT